jgi:hypothetical protein
MESAAGRVADPPDRELTTAVRVFTTRQPKPPKPRKADQVAEDRSERPKVSVLRPYPFEALVFDTETLPGPAQNLRFLVWRLYSDDHNRSPGVTCIEEGIAYPDALPTDSPADFELLTEYVAGHEAEVLPGFGPRIQLRPLSVWLEERLFRYGFSHRDRCAVVGFNLLFDLGRLATHWAPGGKDHTNGFSLGIWGSYDASGNWHDRKWRMRLRLRAIDPRRTLISWGTRGKIDKDEPDRGAGRFVDLRTLAFALTDRSHTLETACAAFGDPYEKHDVDYSVMSTELIAYALDDVRHSSLLYRNCLTELREHPGVDLQPHRLFSPATVGTRYLEAFGLKRPLVKFTDLTAEQLGWDPRPNPRHPTIPEDEARGDLDPALLGYAMGGFFGGRAEARIVRTPVPVAVVDFTSMYPTVNALLGTWPLLCANKLTTVDATDDVRQLLAAPELFDRCHTPELWRRLGVTLVELEPDGDVLPVRGIYDPASDDYGIGVNPLTYQGTLWYLLPEVVAATILNPLEGKPTPPRVVRAIRLVGDGIQAGLRPVKLRGRQTINPKTDDPFVRMIEERQRILRDRTLDQATRDRFDRFLKITANATAYGVLARFDRRERDSKTRLTIYGPDADPVDHPPGLAPEDPGPYCFPPVAAAITSAARLMLALLERHVRAAGGHYAFCDTDSMAIVATPNGDTIPCTTSNGDTITALSWGTVNEIRGRFQQLNPYDPTLVPHPWKEVADSLTEPLYCYAISAKRYCLYRAGPDNQPDLVAAVDREIDPEDTADTDDMLATWSEHGLGLYLDPTATDPDKPLRDNKGRRLWIRDAWQWILAHALDATPALPDWAGRYALTRFSVSSPNVQRWFRGYDASHPKEEAIRPGSFGLLAHPTLLSSSAHLPAATYDPNPDNWRQLDWYDRRTGNPTQITTLRPTDDPDLYADALHQGATPIATLADIITAYQHRPEHKSLAPDHTPAGRNSTGLLNRRPVTSSPTKTELTGKEGNNLEQRATSELTDAGQYRNNYGTRSDTWPETLDALRHIGATEIRRQTGFSRSSINEVLSGRAHPHPRRRAIYEELARMDPSRSE